MFVGNSFSTSLDVTFSGCLDEIEIFNRALTSNEIFALYSASSKGKCHPSCSLPPVVSICSNSVTLTANVFNSGSMGTSYNVMFFPVTCDSASFSPVIDVIPCPLRTN